MEDGVSYTQLLIARPYQSYRTTHTPVSIHTERRSVGGSWVVNLALPEDLKVPVEVKTPSQ